MKGTLLLLVGLGLLKLMHADIATVFYRLIEALHLNADSRIIHALVLKADALQPHNVLVAALVSLGYAAMLLLEGVGLWLERSWAAYLTVISTSLLLPFELYEVIDRVSMLPVGVLQLNLVIVLYLVGKLSQHNPALGGRLSPNIRDLLGLSGSLHGCIDALYITVIK